MVRRQSSQSNSIVHNTFLDRLYRGAPTDTQKPLNLDRQRGSDGSWIASQHYGHASISGFLGRKVQNFLSVAPTGEIGARLVWYCFGKRKT